MNDGSLIITYDITWKVLDSTTEGPLSWVQIGTPNSGFKNPTALTSNIKSIDQYNGSYVKIDFNRSYIAGEQLSFRYSIEQSYMYTLSSKNCSYSFTPAWFTSAKIDNLTVKWKSDNVKSNNSKSTDDGYLVWNWKNLTAGKKVTTKVTYKQSAFQALNKYKQQSNNPSKNENSSSPFMAYIGWFFIIFFVIIISCVTGFGYGGGYYRHRGFYGGYYGGYHDHYHHGGFGGGRIRWRLCK